MRLTKFNVNLFIRTPWSAGLCIPRGQRVEELIEVDRSGRTTAMGPCSPELAGALVWYVPKSIKHEIY